MFNDKSMTERKWQLLKDLNCKECEYYRCTCDGSNLGYHCKAEKDIEYGYERAYEMMGDRQ